MSIFDILVWIGVVLTLAGLAALIWCIIKVARLRRQGLEDELFRDRMRIVLAVNMAALAASALGLMAVAVGAILGG